MRIWWVFIVLVVGAPLHAELFDVDFNRDGAAALRDQSSGVDINTNIKPPETPAQNLVDSPAGKVWRFGETTQVSFATKTAFKPPMTIEMWLCPTQRPLGPLSGLMQHFAYGKSGFRIALLRDPNRVTFYWDGGDKEHGVNTTATLAVGRWHHLAFTLDGEDVLKIYVDGQLDITQKLDMPFVPSPPTDVILGSYSGAIGQFVGLMRGVKISDIVKSDFSQVAGDLQKWNAPPPEGVIPKAVTTPEVDVKTLFAGDLMSVGFEGDLAATINGNRVEPVNVTPVQITEYGRFVPGIISAGSQKAFDIGPFRAIRYPTPRDFPPAKGGTISVWVKPADWFSPKGIEALKKIDWTRRKVIFHADGVQGQWGPWSLGLVVIDKPESQTVRWSAALGGQVELFHTMRLKNQQWYLLAVTWEPDTIDAKRVRARFYINGSQVDEALGNAMPMNSAGEHLNLGSTNAGVAYSGTLDEFHLLDHPLTGGQILAYYRLVHPSTND
ncbi:MAG: LamG domain-containing protein [Phycisphaerales bacterium]